MNYYTTHCTNENCHIRKQCKKGEPMIDGQHVDFYMRYADDYVCREFEIMDNKDDRASKIQNRKENHRL